MMSRLESYLYLKYRLVIRIDENPMHHFIVVIRRSGYVLQYNILVNGTHARMNIIRVLYIGKILIPCVYTHGWSRIVEVGKAVQQNQQRL